MVFTNDAANLEESLRRNVSKTSAVKLRGHHPIIFNLATESPTLANKMTKSGLGLAP
jgi:hypothetical protein